MVRVGGVHGADQGDLVDALGEVGEKGADLSAALSVGFEFPTGAFEEDAFVAGPVFDFGVVEFDLLAVVGGKSGLGVPGVNLAGAACHP